MLAIFDHDGVLVDSMQFHEESWYELGRRTGLSFTREFIYQTFGMTNESIFRKLLGDDVAASEVTRMSDLKEECYREVARGKLELMAGVKELMDGLTGAGAKLAIGSSGPLENLMLTVRSCGVDGRFAAIVGVEDIDRGKPDPQVFLIGAERTGVPPARAVVFEDALVGIQAAKAAGMYAVAVGTTHPLESLLEAGADEAVMSLEGYPIDRLVARLSQSH